MKEELVVQPYLSLLYEFISIFFHHFNFAKVALCKEKSLFLAFFFFSFYGVCEYVTFYGVCEYVNYEM
jgi:hypothetical protein